MQWKIKHIITLFVLMLYLFSTSSIILNISQCGCTERQLTGFFKNTCLGCEASPHKGCESHHNSEAPSPLAFSEKCCQIDLLLINIEDPIVITFRTDLNDNAPILIPDYMLSNTYYSFHATNLCLQAFPPGEFSYKELAGLYLRNTIYPTEEAAIFS